MDLDNIVTLDVECYKNYFLVMFRRLKDGKTIFIEKFNDSEINIENLKMLLNKYTIVTFNGHKYDSVILEAAVCGFSNRSIHKISKYVIESQPPVQPWQCRKQFGLTQIKMDHIDLINVAPMIAGLKVYGGRLHAKNLQDLPIHPDELIKESDLPGMRKYCGNDLILTELLFLKLKPQIELRVKLGIEYGLDLRSKSDAQIAEAVIKEELLVQHNVIAKRPKGGKESYQFKCPDLIEFQTETLNEILELFKFETYYINKSGHIELPPSLKNKKFKIGETDYKIGIGGLHSCEKKTSVSSDDNFQLRDYDVASYYPVIILNNDLFPEHLGIEFLDTYSSLVKRRLKAKKFKDKVANECLKIVINGSFGKFGSKWSCLYSPDLMMQVTVTGQLLLLMLIEQFELKGINIISANTDGIVCKIPTGMDHVAEEVSDEWQMLTDYELESKDYKSLSSRDVNNYIAICSNGTVKGKGVFADQLDDYNMLRNTPTNLICVEACYKYISDNIPVEKTIKESKDVFKFTSLRKVTGGAVHIKDKLGNSVRWYYSSDSLDCIQYLKNGNKVPKTDGCSPMMDLTDQIPTDVDYQWYIDESYKMLKEAGIEYE